MSNPISLKEAERKVFKTSFDDGLWDIFLGCFFLMFAIAPLLSNRLGDFWSSVIFLPIWALVYLAIWLIRKHLVAARVGVVKFGPVRQARLAKFTLVMLIINLVALVLGILAAATFGIVPGQVYAIILGMILLIGFSLAAYFLDFTRLYLYGLLAFLAPLVGEWLFTHGYAAHHGYPVVFSLVSGIMILTGLIVFVRFLRENPIPSEPVTSQGA
jgi:hypothetical protein